MFFHFVFLENRNDREFVAHVLQVERMKKLSKIDNDWALVISYVVFLCLIIGLCLLIQFYSCLLFRYHYTAYTMVLLLEIVSAASC